MKKINKQQKPKIPRWSYAGFLFDTFIHRPFGYVIPCLYVVYLSLILLIVPGIMGFSPLFIWTIGGFNMPVFNLFFIAASAAALAVCIFRTGREDGTELSLSSKPLTKNAMVGMKVLVYLVIMLGFCVISNIITLLTLPIFGVASDTNIRGISYAQYLGLNLSVLFGNIINMLFFGGIAVLISMVGGQVITMIGTVGIVFIMCLMNFIYPQVVTSSIEILRNKYNTEIQTLCCPTYNQYTGKGTTEHKTYATIVCATDEEGEELTHFDTAEYWAKAEKESGGMATNYIDFARQLSSLYSSFGLDESKLKEASKLSIGMNRGYRYTIDEDTHVDDKSVIDANNYPIAFYSMTTRQGMQYPQVLVIGGDMSISTNNWLAISKVSAYDFNSVSIITTGDTIPLASKTILKEYGQTFKKMSDVRLTEGQYKAAGDLYKQLLSKIESDYASDPTKLKEEGYFSGVALPIIEADESGAFFEVGKYKEVGAETDGAQKQFSIVSKIQFAWAVIAHNNQKTSIEKTTTTDTFPFTSKTVNKWYKEKVFDGTKTQSEFPEFALGYFIYNDNIQVRDKPVEETPGIPGYCRLVVGKMNYAETYANMYQYSVSNFYSIKTIMIVWSLVSVIFFTGAIIVYKKTDFK